MLYIQFGTVIFHGECLSAGIFIAWLVPWRATEDTHIKKRNLVDFFSKPGSTGRNPGYFKAKFSYCILELH